MVKPSHYCADWDYEWIERGTPEYEVCTCTNFEHYTEIIVTKSYAQDQADFMDMSGQRRYKPHETLEALVKRDAKFLAEIGMHKGLIDEEVNKEFGLNYIDGIVIPQNETEEFYINTLAKLIDDCVDSVYVIVSFVNKLGFDFDVFWYLVHQANMAKGFPCTDCNGKGEHLVDVMNGEITQSCVTCKGTGKQVKRRGDGKTLKPEGWEAPDAKIKEMVESMIYTSKRKAVEDAQRTDDY